MVVISSQVEDNTLILRLFCELPNYYVNLRSIVIGPIPYYTKCLTTYASPVVLCEKYYSVVLCEKVVVTILMPIP